MPVKHSLESVVSFDRPAPYSSPSLYAAFQSPVNQRDYFAYISGLSLIIADADTNIESIIELKHLIFSQHDDHSSRKVEISALAINHKQQIAVAVGSEIHIGALLLAPVSNDPSVVPLSANALREKLLLTGSDESDTVFDHSIEHIFALHHIASVHTRNTSISSLAFRTVGPYHIDELAAGGINWVSLFTSQQESFADWSETWHYNETLNLFPAPLSPYQLSRSQPSSPISQNDSELDIRNISGIAVSSDGRCLALLNRHPSTELVVHNLDTATRRSWSLSHPSPLISFSFCPHTHAHDNLLSTLCTDGVIRFWRQNQIKDSASAIALSSLSPLNPAIVQDRSIPTSASAEFHTTDNNHYNATHPAGATASLPSLSHAQSTPHLSALNHAEEEATEAKRTVLVEPLIRNDQPDYDWFVCAELELGSVSTASAAMLRNGYVSCLFVHQSVTQASIEATVCAARTSAKFTHESQQSATPLQPPSPHTCGMIAPPVQPSPRVLTIDREGTIQLWYLKDILAVPRMNPTPIPLLTLYQAMAPRYVTPWIFAACSVSLLPSKLDVVLYDCKVRGVAGLDTGDCCTFSMIMRKDERGNDQDAHWTGSFELGRTIGGHRKSEINQSNVPQLVAHPAAPYVASLATNGRVAVWTIDDSHLFLASPGGEIRFNQSTNQSISHETSSEYSCFAWFPSVVQGSVRLIAASNEYIDIWQLDNPRQGFNHVAHLSHGVNEPVVSISVFSAAAAAYQGQSIIVVTAAKSITLAMAPSRLSSQLKSISRSSSPSDQRHGAASNQLRILQRLVVPTQHTSSPITCATALPASYDRFSYSTKDREILEQKTKEAAELAETREEHERATEEVHVITGHQNGIVTVMSVRIPELSIDLLSYFQAHDSRVRCVRARSINRIVTADDAEDLLVWQSISHYFKYELEHTIRQPPAPVAALKASAYFSTHSVTSVRSSTPLSPRGNRTAKPAMCKFLQSFDVVDAGDGQLRVLAGDLYGQLYLYSPQESNWASLKLDSPFTPADAVLNGMAAHPTSIVALAYSPHSLGVITCGFHSINQTPFLRHQRLHSTLATLIDQSPHLPVYHPRSLEAALMTGHINRVKNVLSSLHQNIMGRALTVHTETVKLTNVPISQLLLSSDAVNDLQTATSGQSPSSQPSSDSGQLSMGSFGGFGGFGGGFSSPAYGQSNQSNTSSLAPAISTYVRPALEVQHELSETELEELLKSLDSVSLPYLSKKSLVDLKLVIRAFTAVLNQSRTLDEFAQRYYFAATLYRLRTPFPSFVELSDMSEQEETSVKPLPYNEQVAALPSMPSLPLAFAYHSSSVDTLLPLLTSHQPIDQSGQSHLPHSGLSWDVCRQLGLGYWVRGSELSTLIEQIAKAQYLINKNPNDCFLYYLAMGKKAILLGLMKQNSKYDAVFQFMSQNFQEQDAKIAASKNAFRALTKRKYHLAAGFFILAGMLGDAVNICMRQMRDPQLAIVLCRLVEGENSSLLKKVLIDDLIPFAHEFNDPIIEYVALQSLKLPYHACRGLVDFKSYDPVTASLLRLINHSKLRLFSVPAFLINLAERRAAFEFSRCGLGLLALEEFPSVDLMPTEADERAQREAEAEEESALRRSTISASASSDSGQLSSFGSFGSFGSSSVNSGQVSMGGGFGQGSSASGQISGFGGGFGQANSSSGQVSMTSGFGQSSFGPASANSGQVSMSGGFGQANAASGQVSMSGGFGQANAASGQVSMSGGFGQANAASGQVSMSGGFGQSSFGQAASPVADTSSGSLSGFGSFGSFGGGSAVAANSGQISMSGGFGQASAASGQVSMTGGFGQSSTSNPNTGALGGSFGSFGSFGSSPSPPPTVAPMSLSSFGSFGQSPSPTSSPSPSLSTPEVVKPYAPTMPSRPKLPQRDDVITVEAHRRFMSSVRVSFVQQAANLFLASRVPLATAPAQSSIDSQDAEFDGIISDIRALQRQFALNPLLSVHAVTVFTLIFGHYSAYLALTLQLHFSGQVIDRPLGSSINPVELPQPIELLLIKELRTLSSLLHRESFSDLRSNSWSQTSFLFNQLMTWRVLLSSPRLPERVANLSGEWSLVNTLLQSSLLLWAMRISDYTTVASVIEGKFSSLSASTDQAALLPIGLKERLETARIEKERQLEEERRIHGDDIDEASLGLPPIVDSFQQMDLFGPLREQIGQLARFIYLHCAINQHQANFNQFVNQKSHPAGNLTNNPETQAINQALQSLNQSLILCSSHLSAKTIHQFHRVMRAISYHKADYEHLDADDDPAHQRQFPLHDQLIPLSEPNFPFGDHMLEVLKLDQSLPALANEIERYFECERNGSPWLHGPLDVFRLTERGDVITSIAFNTVEPRMIAIGGAFGSREIDVPSTLRFRERSPDSMTLTQHEESTYCGCLHRYDKMYERDDFGTSGQPPQRASFPKPRSVLAYMLHAKPAPLHPTNVFGSSLLHSRVYEDFTGPSVRDQLSGQNNKDAVERDMPAQLLTAHPTLPMYISLSGNRVLLWHFHWSQPIAEFATKASVHNAAVGKRQTVGLEKGEHITRFAFNATGNRLAACTSSGRVLVWVFAHRSSGLPRVQPVSTGNNRLQPAQPDTAILAYDLFEAHSRSASDLAFVDNGQMLATVGDSHQGTNVCVWSLLLPSDERLCIAFKCHEASQGAGGASAMAFIPSQTCIVVGGARGSLAVCDLTTKSVIKKLEFGRPNSSTARVQALHYDASADFLIAANGDGIVRIWDVTNWTVIAEYSDWFHKQSAFMSGLYGVTAIASHRSHLVLGCADGSVRYLRKKRAALMKRPVLIRGADAPTDHRRAALAAPSAAVRKSASNTNLTRR